MKLSVLRIEGLKCFKDLVEIPIKNLSILIGENDAGKTSILDAVEYLITKKPPSLLDYSDIAGDSSNQIMIEGVFVPDTEFPIEIRPYCYENQLTIRKQFSLDSAPVVTAKFAKLSDARLAEYDSLQAQDTQDLLTQYNLPSYPNQTLRREALGKFIETNFSTLPKDEGYHAIEFNKIASFVPVLERYSSADYSNPRALITKTLNQIYRSFLYDETGALKNQTLSKLKKKIEGKLDTELSDRLLQKIKKFNPKIIAIRGDFSIDFARGFELNDLGLDEGQGFKLSSAKGEGSRKRLSLSIMEWDKEIQNQLKSQSIIRVYDEPDTSLHYDAQRKMYYTIYETSAMAGSKIQNLIATHSISMIDRASADSINHIRMLNGISRVEYLRNEGNDAEMRDFLQNVAEISGIKNSSIFYEKCFLIVEGESEENALPILYKKAIGRSLIEDGVVLINIQSNGSWKNFLKLLNQNKRSVTLLMLDSDTQNADSPAKITVEKLQEIGFPSEFLTENVFFAGSQEFEDLFPDALLRDVMNELHPRATIRKWTLRDVRKIRSEYDKISKGLAELAQEFIAQHHKRYSKPEFALKLVQKMKAKEIKLIPVFSSLFEKVQQVING